MKNYNNYFKIEVSKNDSNTYTVYQKIFPNEFRKIGAVVIVPHFSYNFSASCFLTFEELDYLIIKLRELAKI